MYCNDESTTVYVQATCTWIGELHMTELIGKICPYCKTAIHAEEVKVCGTCSMPHHLACWQENQGCTTFGCTEHRHEVNAVAPETQHTPIPATQLQPIHRQTLSSYLQSVRQLAKSDLMIAIPFWFFVLGIIFVLIGILYPVPSRSFLFSDITEYVGGDAYNGTIEAAIRGGEIAGAQMAKAMYICGGMLLAALSLFKIQSIQQSSKD